MHVCMHAHLPACSCKLVASAHRGELTLFHMSFSNSSLVTDTPKLGFITSIVQLGDSKAQEIGYLAAGPEFEPGVGSVGTAVAAMAG